MVKHLKRERVIAHKEEGEMRHESVCVFVLVLAVIMIGMGNAFAGTYDLNCDTTGCQVGFSLVADSARGLSCTGCVTSTMIQNGTILFANIAPNGCSSGHVMKYGTGGWYCGTDATGITAETDPKVGALSSGKWCTSNGSVISCTQNAPVLSEVDPKVGTLNANQWCATNGSVINCDKAEPAAAGHNHWGQTWSDSGFSGLTLDVTGQFANSNALSGRAVGPSTGGETNGTGVRGVVAPYKGDAWMVDPTGVAGISQVPAGGWNSRTYGVYGQAGGTDAYGVYGYATQTGTAGVADGAGGVGVYGENTASGGRGVYGKGSDGVYGESPVTNGSGVVGEAHNGIGAYGVYGRSTSGYAGYFLGKVHVSGTLTKLGGSFRIDHPLDPRNKYLSHSFVESPDMKNVYDGTVILDGKGEAWVDLPAWFEALNRDFRYQLTCIGGFAGVYVAEEVSGNRFKIGGGTPGLKVSWQVTGIRHDPWANDHRIEVETAKASEEVDTYLYPQGYGQPETVSVDSARLEKKRQAGAKLTRDPETERARSSVRVKN